MLRKVALCAAVMSCGLAASAARAGTIDWVLDGNDVATDLSSALVRLTWDTAPTYDGSGLISAGAFTLSNGSTYQAHVTFDLGTNTANGSLFVTDGTRTYSSTDLLQFDLDGLNYAVIPSLGGTPGHGEFYIAFAADNASTVAANTRIVTNAFEYSGRADTWAVASAVPTPATFAGGSLLLGVLGAMRASRRRA